MRVRLCVHVGMKQCGFRVANFNLCIIAYVYLLQAQLDQSETSTKVKTKYPFITLVIAVVNALLIRVRTIITKPP